MADFDPITTTIFVSVSDKVLSVRDDGLRAPRVACESLDLAQGLVQSNPRSRVILVCQAGISAFTALDAVASLLGGMAGLVEDRLLIAEGVLDSVLCLHHLDRKGRLMLMLGESADRLQGIQAMLAEWELDDEADDIVDLKCFRAAMALAQLDRLRPLRGPGDPYSFVKLAQALNLAESKTLFRLSPGDLRKTLSKLADRFIGLESEHVERVKLPEYARKRDFPPNPPVIRGIPEREISRRLYLACSSIRVERQGLTNGVELWSARLPMEELRHLAP